MELRVEGLELGFEETIGLKALSKLCRVWAFLTKVLNESVDRVAVVEPSL